jgi:PIN domain nuclease of toxin-antitoxin system
VTVLRDTPAFLWFVLDDPKLSAPARQTIADPSNRVLISPATYWEIAIKISLGKYALPGPYAGFIRNQLRENHFEILPVLPEHTALLTDLPFHHRDPFDRLLIAQAVVNELPLISIDTAFDAYPVQRLW